MKAKAQTVSRLSFFLMFVVAAVLLVLGFLLYLFFRVSIFGAFDTGQTSPSLELKYAVIAGVGTAAGIFSKMLYDILSKPGQPDEPSRTRSFYLRALLISLLIAPVVVASFLTELMQMENSFLAAIFAYQNGFFFHTIVGGKQ